MIPALEAALAAGAILRAEGDRLALRSPAPLKAEIRIGLMAAKTEILAFLGPGRRIGPASAAQRAIWLADAAGRGYAVTAATRLRSTDLGPAPGDQIAAALGVLATRHPALRTRLLLVGEEPAQLVEPNASLPLETSEAADMDAALARTAAWAAVPLDPTVVPPGRALLLRAAEGEWIFALSLHHAVCDAASLDILAGDLARLLQQPAGHPAPLPQPGPDMLDHAALERIAPAPDEALRWWRDTLLDVPPLVLGAEPLRPASGGGRDGAVVPRTVWDALTAAGRVEGATPFGTLLGVLGVVLARHAADPRLLLHTPATVRGEGFERCVGCFASLLPLVLDMHDDPPFATALRRGAAAATALLSHTGVALSQIATIAPASARPALLFTHRRGGGGMGEPLPLPPGVPKADLVLESAEGPDGLTLSLEWDRAVIDDGIAAALLEELVCEAIDRGVTPPGHAALHAALAPVWPDAGDATIHGLFAARVATDGEREAVRDTGGNLTYAALDGWSDAIATSLGPVRDTVIGIALPRGASMVAAWLGCLKAGAAYLPLDPAWPAARREAVLAAAKADRVLDAAMLPAPDTRVSFQSPPVHPLALACVFATSGSTGQPKAVGVPHRAIPRLAMSRAFAAIEPGDVVAQAGSAAFDAASWEVWGALLNGATVAVLDTDTVLDADALATALAEQRVGHMFLTKTLFDAAAAARPDAFAGLRTLTVGGEALDPLACAAIVRPERFLNVYGPTETATFAAWHPVPSDVASMRRVPVAGPPGGAIHGTLLRVLDHRMRPAAIGALGELYIGGDALGRGYLGQPGLTAERFLPDPHGPPGVRIYRTGDRARLLPDGSVDLLGRIDQQVKIRGFRVEPGEVQAALRGLPGVVAAHVDARLGVDGTVGLFGWVVGIDAAMALDGLRAVLPAAMIPARIWRLPRLPVATTGKVDVAALPTDERSGTERVEAPPCGATEEAVAELARGVLGLSSLGRHDDLFALGAHSLSAMRLLARLRVRFGVDLSLRAIFETPTVAGLAARLPDVTKPGSRLTRDTPPTLLPAQERVWLLTRLGNGTAWHIPIAVRLRGQLDPAALGQAFEALLVRHVALRTGIVEQDGRPVAVLHPPAPLPFKTCDAPADLDAALTEEVARPFDLAQGPFLRVTLWHTGPDEHVLLLVLHHAAADGWSVGVVLREAAARYAGLELPPVGPTVFDWARAVRERDSAADVTFWRDWLADAAPPRLPTRARGGSGLVRRRLPAGLAQAARACRTTPFVLGAAAWAAVLARRANAPDLLLGTVLAGRDHPETEGLVGMLVQTLPLRLDLRDDPAGTTLIARMMAALEVAHTHRGAPFDAIVGAAGHAGAGADALLPHLVVLQNQPWPSDGLPGLAAEEVMLPAPDAKADTTLALDAQLSEAALEYRTDRMGEPEATELLAAFDRVLTALVAVPETRLSALPVVIDPSMLIGAEAGVVPSVLHWDDRAALVEMDVTLAGAELRRHVDAVAARLVARGIGPDTLVGLCAERSVAQVVALLGILRAGAAWLPLEPGQPSARLMDILTAARPAIILADAAGAVSLATAAPDVRSVPLDGGDPLANPKDWPEPHPLAAAYALFTSGSTGAPKAVVVPRDALARHMAWMDRALPLRPDDVLLLKTPMGFDASVWEYLAAFRAGATLYVAPEGAQRDAAALLRAVAESRATVLQLVPSVLAALLREPGFDAACANLRRLCLGGEAVPRALVEAITHRLPRCQLVNLYGPAEATIDTITQDGMPPADMEQTMPIGRPIEGVRAWLADRWGAPVGSNTPGRLWLAGPALARGYLGQPGLTADRFRPDPFGPPGSRALNTGDVARQRGAGGELEWLGRADRQAKLHGVRVEPAEVETALLGLGVAEAAAAVVEGPAGPVLAAWIVTDRTEPAALKTALAERLPSALVPSRITILPTLPRLPNGKLDRRALHLPHDTGAEPADPLEEIVAATMATLLGVSRVAREADFFALGGHSLLAAQLAARLREATGRDIPLAALFAAPTPAGLARLLDGAPMAAPLSVLPSGVALPLGAAQRRLWAAYRLSGGDSRWTIGGPMVLRGNLKADAIGQAIAATEARHEPLRTRFVEDIDGPMQVADKPDFRLEQAQSESLPDALADAAAFMTRPFDLSVDRPFRARLTNAGPGLWVLSLAIHHIAADGWSIGVLLRELSGHLSEDAPTLPPVPRYAEVAAWMDAQDTGPALTWWRGRLMGMELLRLPGDGPRPDQATGDAAALPVALDGAATALAQDCGATRFMALAAGLAVALHEATGQTDICLGTDVADRRHAAAERLIGFFANQVVLRLDLAGNPTVRVLMGRVRTATLGMFAHQHVSADRVLAGLPPIRAKITWQPAPAAPATLAGCSVEWPDVPPAAIPFDLLVNLVGTETGTIGTALYRPAALRSRAVGALLTRFGALLAAMAAAPEAPLSSLLAQPGPVVADVAGHAPKDQAVNETYPLSPVQRRLWECGAGEATAEYAITGASPDSVLQALEVLTARWEILRTQFPVPPGLAVAVQEVGPDPAWTATVIDGGLRVTMPGLAMDRQGFALLGQAMANELAGAEPMDGPQYPDVAGWLEDLATSADGETGRQFWAREARAWEAVDIPVPPAGDRSSTAALPSGIPALAGRWRTTADIVLLGAWHLLLQRLSGRLSSRVAVAADGRAQAVLARALGLLTRWLPGELAIDPALPLAAALPALAEATEQRRRWQDYTPGGAAAFGFRSEPATADDRVRLLRYAVPEDAHALRLVHVDERLTVEGTGSEYVLDALLALLAGLVEYPDAPAGTLPIMPKALRDQLVVQFNATARAFPTTDVIALFEAACDRDPDAPALRHAGVTLSFGVVDARANAAAQRLTAIGIGPEHRVGLAVGRSQELVIGMLGILKAGAAFVPLDPANPPARRAWIAADAGLAALLHTADLTPPEGVPALLLDAAEVAGRPRHRRHPDTLAYVLHTSGSTGQPKGVAVTHRGLTNYLLWAGDAYRPEAGRGVPVHTSPAFDLTLTALLLPLTRGQWLDLQPENDSLTALAAGFAGSAGWSLVKLTPSHLKALGTEPNAGGTGRLVVGGEALFGEQLAAWATSDPAMPVVNEYGPTETVVGCCVYQAPAGDLPPGPVPIGSPIANTTMLVLDRQGQAVPPGVAGEAWVGGAGVARGYLGRPDLTADRFRPDPIGPPGARVYRTGDLVRHRWHGGLDYLGRADDQLKVAGHRIEPAEVEAALLRLFGVDQAAVLQQGDSLLGFVVPDRPVTPEELRDALAATLPPWMVPARLRLIPALPLAPSGKADRAALLALPEAMAERLAPRDAREAALAAIWERVLGQPVGVLDDFFQLGGDSIRGLQVVARARRIGLSLPPDAVFRHPTVAALAVAAEGVLAAPEAAEDGAWFPLHPIQARFLTTAGDEPWHEVQSLLLRPRTRPEPAALEHALAAVQRRHGMLRARFGRSDDGMWRQRVDPMAEAPRLAVHDPLDEADLEQIGTALKRSLDLAHGPLWCAALFDLADGPALLLTAHHLVIDRVSWGPLLDDLARALAGEALDPPPSAFAAWVTALLTAQPATEIAPASSVTLPLDDPDAPVHRLDRTILAPASQTDVLTALAHAISAWAGLAPDVPFVIEVEHHGRDASALGVRLDMSETVGWFTVLAPIPVRGDIDPATINAALEALPRRGLAVMLSSPTAPSPQVLLNHLGRMDLIGGDFEPIGRSTGPDRSPLRPPSHAIELVTAQTGDALHCTWHTAGLSPANTERLAVLFERHLLALTAPKATLRRRLPPGAMEAIEQRLGPVQAVLPATPAQRGMLYHSALDPAGGAYVEQTVMRVSGVLDPAALRAAWTALMRRHAALRTLFSPDEHGDLAQVVLRTAEPVWLDEDWRAWPDPEAALASLVAEDRAAGFDPQAVPPLRFRLVRLREAEWWFLWTRHHALLDGWSLSPLLTELLALAEGRTLPPPADPVAVSDVLAARDAATDEAYWRLRLKDAEPTPLGGRDTAKPARATAHIDRRVNAAHLLAYARHAGVTPATLLALAWGLVLAHDAGRPDPVFAMTSSGRSAGTENAVGLFLTTLPVRVALDPEADPADFLRALQADLAASRAHEHCPPEVMLACAGLPPGTPLATSLLTYENYPVDPALSAPRPDAPRILAVESAEQSSFPLSLLAGMEADEMILSLRFDPTRFDADSAARRLDRVAAALDGLTTAGRLGMVLPTPAISDFEHGPTIEHKATPLHDLVLAQASRTPNAPAVLWGDIVITYAELACRARGVAGALRAAGIRRGDVVGLKTERCEALLPALLGTLLTGAAWCPLEPDQPPQRLAAMAADARVRVMLCGLGVIEDGGLPLDAPCDPSGHLPALTADDTAYVLFTSGSTGRPKGVAVPHGAIVNRLGWMQRAYPIGPGDVVLQKTPLGFDVCIWELFWPLLTGASVVVAPPGVQRDPDAMAATMAQHRVSVLHFVPSMLRGFLDTTGIEHRCGNPRLVFTSGEALTPDLVAAWQDRFQVPLRNLYGPTEAAVDVTAWDCGTAEAAGAVPIGRPVDNVVTRVLDSAMRRRLSGDLWLGGVQLASGYVNAPASTADAFRPDPFGSPGARLYRTGDRAAWRSDGALLYYGRSDAQVKLRGVRIEIGEIEATLLSHPAIREAAVRLLGDRLVAWVAPEAPADLDGFLGDRLPPVMRPSRVIAQPNLPLTASGKLDRRALTAPGTNIPPPALPRGALPRGALEVRIATLAAEVLGRQPGPLEDLVALGLHSLGAVRLLNLLRRDLGAAPPLSALHGARSVAGLAAAVAGAELRPNPLVRLRSGTGLPLVLVHPVGGDIACFLRLAARLDRPVFGLQARGLLGDAPTANIEAMAEEYADALRAEVPGPVALAGYSMGCAVAFEMARRLGRQVKTLLLLDGSAERTGPDLPGISEPETMLAHARTAGLIPEGFRREDMQRVMAVMAANQRALSDWHPAPADLSAELIRTSADDGDRQWGRLAQGGLRIRDVAATHDSLLEEPCLTTLIPLIEAMLLDEAVPT